MVLDRAPAFALLLSILCCPIVGARLEFSNDHPKQGETVEVTVCPSDAATSQDNPLLLHLVDHKIKLFPVDRGEEHCARCLLAVPADLDPGKYSVSVGAEKSTLTVCDGGFPLQHLRLPPEKDNFNMSPGEEEAVEGAKKTISDTRFWEGKFKAPSLARRSAAFGIKRIVNGRLLKDYFHSGLDYAAGLGTPVLACAPGKVVLARTGFKLHGNVVAIDHGQGVISFYIHLQKLFVKQGDEVAQGEKIGLVGQTGRATGPHLHFSIYVNEVAANPVSWFSMSY
jgi:murein DD-endopeptidase MepM/ murein hydrolase activator NlpD